MANRYPNRSDLRAQPVRTVSSAEYGKRAEQERAQQQVPLPALPMIAERTGRPTEPVTAGLPVGPGPGPEVLAGGPVANPDENVEMTLRALYKISGGDPDIGRLLELYLDGF